MLLALLVFKVIIIVYFPQYSEAWLISVFLIISEYFCTLTFNHGNTIVLYGKIKLLIVLNLIILIIQIILAFIFSNLIGEVIFMGIPIFLSFLLSNLFMQFLFYVLNNKNPSLLKNIKSIVIMQVSASIIAVTFGFCLGGYLNLNGNIVISFIVIITFIISIKKSYIKIKDLNNLIN